jgi:hypothetical protein
MFNIRSKHIILAGVAALSILAGGTAVGVTVRNEAASTVSYYLDCELYAAEKYRDADGTLTRIHFVTGNCGSLDATLEFGSAKDKASYEKTAKFFVPGYRYNFTTVGTSAPHFNLIENVVEVAFSETGPRTEEEREHAELKIEHRIAYEKAMREHANS